MLQYKFCRGKYTDDGLENQIDLDTVSVVTSDSTIATLPASPAQTELMPDGEERIAFRVIHY